jgi:hypothetical protein
MCCWNSVISSGASVATGCVRSRRGELEIPSDFGGVVYEQFDASGGWKLALGRELRAAGFEIDWNKVHE